MLAFLLFLPSLMLLVAGVTDAAGITAFPSIPVVAGMVVIPGVSFSS